MAYRYKIALVFKKDGKEVIYRDQQAVEKFKALNPTYILRDAMLAGIVCQAHGGEYRFKEEVMA